MVIIALIVAMAISQDLPEARSRGKARWPFREPRPRVQGMSYGVSRAAGRAMAFSANTCVFAGCRERTKILAQVLAGTYGKSIPRSSRLGAFDATKSAPPGTLGYSLNVAIGMFYKKFADAGEHQIGTVFWSPEVQAILNDPLEGSTNIVAGEVEHRYWTSVKFQDLMEGKMPIAGFIGSHMRPGLRQWLQTFVSGSHVPDERKMAAQIRASKSLAGVGGGKSIGSVLYRSSKLEVALPLSLEEAKVQGYRIVKKCTRLGLYRASKDGQITNKHPTAVYYAGNGLISGFSVDMWGPPFPAALAAGMYEVVNARTQQYRLNLLFRRESQLCSPSVQFQSSGIGDQVVVVNHKGSSNWMVPLSPAEASQQGYSKGACLPKMGTHFTMDLSRKNGTMSWDARQLHPVVAMYDVDGSISGILIQSFVGQHSMSSTNEWDIIPVPNSVACGNFCDTACKWTNHDGRMFGALHLFFKDFNSIACPSGMCGKTGMMDSMAQSVFSMQLPRFRA